MEKFFQVLDSVKKTFIRNGEYDLNESYEVLSSLLTHSADPIVLVTVEGFVRQVNPAFEKMYGWTLEELKGKQLPFHEHLIEMKELVERVRGGETIIGYPTIRHDKYGKSVHVSITLSPIRNSKGDIIAVSSIIRNVEDFAATEKELNESRSKYKSLFKYCPDPIFSLNTKGNILEVNKAALLLCEATREEVENTHFLSWIHEEDIDTFIQHFQKSFLGSSSSFELQLVVGDQVKHVLCSTIPIVVNHQVMGVYCVVQDRTESMKAASKLERSESRYRLIADQSRDLIVLLDRSGMITYATPSHYFLLGYKVEEVVGKPMNELIVTDDINVFQQKVYESILLGKTFKIRIQLKRSEDTPIWCEVQGTPVFDNSDQFQHVILTSRDITKQVEYEEELKQLAFYDELTGLPNRRVFLDRAQLNLSRTERLKGSFAIFYIDGDHFKDINDQYGHDMGDEFLKLLSDRFKNCIREDDTVSRFGGDEFVVLLSNIQHRNEAMEAAKRLSESVADPFIIREHKIVATISIGISTFPENGKTVEELLKRADEALYDAKKKGKNQLVMADESQM
ncbi:hypothetical protein Q75_16705 [Bacillus coahuilensis p1.1.43]|uniref:Diguanylate cyclase n=1 Tax=Bacillus coahuilensis p1.1.43 TaxID=1150625 RepID=A0A147K445_9BACI|nr:sensor domain-containing diguanylate cyclase [Bacillus coahuilensis]KUP04059.1 hypothetical protein Q75_16705 [Bacillus coahuilensis p1.1.43]